MVRLQDPGREAVLALPVCPGDDHIPPEGVEVLYLVTSELSSGALDPLLFHSSSLSSMLIACRMTPR